MYLILPITKLINGHYLYFGEFQYFENNKILSVLMIVHAVDQPFINTLHQFIYSYWPISLTRLNMFCIQHRQTTFRNFRDKKFNQIFVCVSYSFNLYKIIRIGNYFMKWKLHKKIY